MSIDVDVAYAAPVNRLLTLGVISPGGKGPDDWLDYRELGFETAHIPALIRMATDPELHNLEDPDPALYAPVHAWRALAQMRAEEASEPLLSILEIEGDDWALEELRDIYGLIGPTALPVLERYGMDRGKDPYHRSGVYEAIVAIANNFPEARSRAVEIFLRQLSGYREEELQLNNFLVDAAIEGKLKEAAPLIEEIYQAEHVEERFCGPLEDVLIRIGAKEPTPEYLEQERLRKIKIDELLQGYHVKLQAIEKAERMHRQAEKKVKEKRKAEKNARRKNRRK